MQSILNNNRQKVFDACEHGDVSIISNRIRRNHTFDYINEDGYTPLIVATINNKLDIVKILCNYEKINIDDIDDEGYTALFHAVINNNPKMVELLLSMGANYSIMSDSYFPMHHAVMMEYNDIVRILYNYGNKVPNNYLGLGKKNNKEIKVDELNDKLILSIKNNDINCLMDCISKGYNINKKFYSNKVTPLIYATELGNLEIIKILCENGADLNIIDDIGSNAFLVADILGRQDIISYFNSLK